MTDDKDITQDVRERIEDSSDGATDGASDSADGPLLTLDDGEGVPEAEDEGVDAG